MDKVYILTLDYDIEFHDSDEGYCYAGEGCKILGVYSDLDSAEEIATEFSPIVSKAEKEHIVFPVQKYNRLLKRTFGFTIHDLNVDGSDFKLSVNTFDVESMPSTITKGDE